MVVPTPDFFESSGALLILTMTLISYRTFIVACALSALPFGALAQNLPPLITDDPGTPGPRAWEVNVSWTHERRSGERTDDLPKLELIYGLGERFQVKYETAGRHAHIDGEDSRHGLGSSLAGVKWRFLDRDGHGTTASVAPQIEFRTPGSSAHQRGLADDGTGFILPLAFQKNVGPIAVIAEVGRIFRSRTTDEWMGGVAMVRELTSRVSLSLELQGASDVGFDSRAAAVHVGAHVGVGERSALMLSLGREITNTDSPRASVVAYVGWQLRL